MINSTSCLIVVITGPNRSGVVGARSRIEVIVESSRQKIPFTHFLCFPLYKSNLAKKVDEFKVRVLKDCFEVKYLKLNNCFYALHVYHFENYNVLKIHTDNQPLNYTVIRESCNLAIFLSCLFRTVYCVHVLWRTVFHVILILLIFKLSLIQAS